MNASTVGHTSGVKLLLQAGADKDAINKVSFHSTCKHNAAIKIEQTTPMR
jgi:hypothetical protein